MWFTAHSSLIQFPFPVISMREVYYTWLQIFFYALLIDVYKSKMAALEIRTLDVVEKKRRQGKKSFTLLDWSHLLTQNE